MCLILSFCYKCLPSREGKSNPCLLLQNRHRSVWDVEFLVLFLTTLLYSLILVPKLRAGLLLFHLPDHSPSITQCFEGCCHVVYFPVNIVGFFFLSNGQTLHSLSIGGFPVTSWNHCLEFIYAVQKYSQ